MKKSLSIIEEFSEDISIKRDSNVAVFRVSEFNTLFRVQETQAEDISTTDCKEII